MLYEYDANGNVVTETRNGAETTYTYDSLDRLLSVTYSDGLTVAYEYDALNNRTKETYSNGDVKDYVYDANGIRTQKNDKQYIIDINNNVVAETDSTGAITDEILWGHQPLARKVNDSWYYYIYNAHGDVVGLVNESGTVVNTYEYTPWGEIRNETEYIDEPRL